MGRGKGNLTLSVSGSLIEVGAVAGLMLDIDQLVGKGNWQLHGDLGRSCDGQRLRVLDHNRITVLIFVRLNVNVRRIIIILT